MSDQMDTAEYLEELARTLASHGSNIAALRMAELEQKVSPYLAAPGVPSAIAGGGGSLAGVNTAYAPTVAMGAAGLFVTDGAITVTNAGSVVIIDGTSNMFKIQATGTLSREWPASAPDTVSAYTTLYGYAPSGVLPLMVFVMTQGASSPERSHFRANFSTTGHAFFSLWPYYKTSGTNDIEVYLQVQACTYTLGAGEYALLRYYCMKEAAI